MRFSEVEQNDKLEWLIRKDGCMHCADPGCLKACPAEGAIIQYANGIVDFQSEQCIGCGYCIAGCPFNVPRLNPEDNRVYKCTLCVDRVNVGRAGVRENLPDRRYPLWLQRGYENAGRRARRRAENPRLRQRGPVRSGRRWRHARDVRAAPRRQTESVPRPAGEPGNQRHG